MAGDGHSADGADAGDFPPMSGIAQVLHEDIMKDVEAVLSQKADNLWRRGQAELSKLQQERKQVATCLKELQDRQEQLVAEHTAMRSALVDITTKLEFVATEMREAIRSMPLRMSGWHGETSSAEGGGHHALPQATIQPLVGGICSASGLAKSPSCAGLQSPSGHHGASSRGLPAACAAATAACAAAQAAVTATTAAPGLELAGAVAGALAAAEPLEPSEPSPGQCTPRRSSTRAGTPVRHSAQPLPGSPAVLLSLASALPSAATPPSAGPPSGPPSKRVQIADCLELGAGSTAPRPEVRGAPVGLTLSGVHPAASYMSDYSPAVSEASGGLPGGFDDQALAPQEKARWNALRPDLQDLWLPGGGPTLLGGPGQPQGAGPAVAKAQAQLRAEAPAFVPGGADSVAEEPAMAFNSLRQV